jgi:hypothetical protein
MTIRSDLEAARAELWIWRCAWLFWWRTRTPFRLGADMARQRIADDGGINCTPAQAVTDELEYWTE